MKKITKIEKEIKNMLEINNLSKHYGKTVGIKDLNLEIKKGEIFGFIGPNGSGKSTTIRCIMNLIKKTTGQITINGIDNERADIKEIIGYLPSEIVLYEDLTVLKMLKYNNSFYKKDYLKNGLDLCSELQLDTNKMVEDLSLGNLKKLGIVLALMHKPKLLILDEPTSGLDPLIQNKFYNILKKEKELGTTIFFSSHILSEVKKVCDKVGIVKNNRLLKKININDIKDIDKIKVYIESDYIKEIEKELRLEIIDNTFFYHRNYNDLLEILSKYKISKLLIDEPTIEDIFLKYYEVK